uniref:DNA polymerase III subunit gamma/tau n=1 Tax=uncultured Chloroflexota bacterium TaxID=166587 RepID=H5SPC1_9CHLR|nr:DNA polymerase III subunit gamma/tau [uncultured Chloroflexota bacterium]
MASPVTSQALYRKWRSQTFAEVVGQQHVTQTLVNALKLDRVAHAYLFAGPRGTGKTTTARLLAKAVNCQAEDQAARPCNRCEICLAVNEGRLLDLIEIDAASNTGVDDIRDLREKVNFRPGQARRKFYIIDEVHMLSNSAFNALLKTLEEPPEHVIFVLATTEPEKIPATITSRCQRFDFRRIKLADIVNRLSYIVEQEGLKAEPAALEYIARQASGSMRDAISLLDQLTAYGTETITLELVQTVLGAVTSQAVMALVDALIERNVAAGLDLINQIISEGVDPRQLARELVEYLRSVMLVKLGNGQSLLNVPDETLAVMTAQAARAEGAVIVRATSLFNQALVDIKSGLLAVPQLPLELAFVEAITSTTASQPVETVRETPVEVETVSRSSEAPPRSVFKEPEQMPAGTGVTVEAVQRCFASVLKEIEKKNKVMAEALRNQTRLHKVAGNELYFATSEMLKKRFEKPQPQAAINEAFSKAVGQKVIVRFVSEAVAPKVSSAGPGEEDEDIDSEALLKVAQDLGGQIVE